MTSNQIQAAAVYESVRHDQATEGETNRHNVATEQLQSDANAISAEKNQITATYNSESLRLQKEYNTWYAKYSEASLEAKVALEAEGNAIKQQMADTDASYKLRMSEIAAMEADVKQRATSENIRHNVATEIQAQASIANEWYFRELEIREKQRANDLTAEQNAAWKKVTERGQDLTFDAGVISALTKSGLDLSVPGFRIGVKGLGPMTTMDLFNTIIGDRYGTKEEPKQESLTPGKEESISGKILRAERRDQEGGKVSIPGKLR